MVGRIFNGKQFKRLAGYGTKRVALRVAAENRRGGWNARVAKEGNEWAVYTRKKLR